jgi:ABC-type Na+ transport system ATPase subunit NatA
MLAKQSLGVVFQQNHFNRYLTVWDNVKLHATLHGLSEKQATKRMTELFESLGMMSLKHRHPDALSGGQQRRVAMIRALVHRPKLLFLDEPSTGLDPQARRQVWRMIKTLQADHALSVVLTTHYMEEAETLSDDMLLLHEGRMLFHGSKQALKQQFASASLPQTLAVHPSLGTPTRYVCTLSRWLTQEEQIQLEAYFYQHYPHLPACFRFPEGEAQPTQSPRFDWYLYPLTHETHPNPSPQAPVPWQRPELGELASFLNQYTGTQLLGIQPYVMPLEDILDALSQVPS